MENYYTTETNLIAYLSNSNDVEAARDVEKWISSNNNNLLINIVDILWKTIV